MKGIVIDINSKIGFVAVDTENGITVFELLGDYKIDVNDEISGNLESRGGETLSNITKKEDIKVYIRGVQCTPQFARKLLV